MPNQETTTGVTVALAVRPHGVRGEIACDIYTDFPDRLKALKSVQLGDGRRPTRKFSVRKCWLSHSHGGQAVFLFEGIDSMDAARTLVGYEVQIAPEDRVKLPNASHYISDLVGCRVIDHSTKKEIGIVKDVQSIGDSVAGTPVLEVSAAGTGEEILIPLAQDICIAIDTAAKIIEVALPEGLLDVNVNTSSPSPSEQSESSE
jgi:16S rRNA processing protein RimM